MKVSEAMTKPATVANAGDSIQQAAKMMLGLDAGVLPVGEQDRLIGMITDRDITVKAIAQGKGPDATIRDIMTPEVKYCFDDQDVDEVTRSMAELQIRRVPVLNRAKRLVGILSLGDVAVSGKKTAAGEALHGVSRAGGAQGRASRMADQRGNV